LLRRAVGTRRGHRDNLEVVRYKEVRVDAEQGDENAEPDDNDTSTRTQFFALEWKPDGDHTL